MNNYCLEAAKWVIRSMRLLLSLGMSWSSTIVGLSRHSPVLRSRSRSNGLVRLGMHSVVHGMIQLAQPATEREEVATTVHGGGGYLFS